MATRYHAEQVGSLLRPPEVLEAHLAYDQKRIPLEELRGIEDRAILQALDLQQRAGIEVFTDGEYRRATWAGDFPEAMDGYVDGPPPISFDWRMPDATERAPAELMR